MENWQIDINCDVGEGIGNETSLFPLISSCNIACGGHAGDVNTMRDIAGLAMEHKLKIGAHPSYPDREHFGRVSMKIPPHDLQAVIHEQLTTLQNILRRQNALLHHIKPHGALYNDMMADLLLANTFLEAISYFKSSCFLFVPYGSVIAEEASKQGFKIQYEAFADRRYLGGYHLAPRKMAGAVIESPEAVLQQLLGMVKEKKLRTLDGRQLPIEAQTFCIHGDTPSAFQILMYLAKELPNQGIYLNK